MNNQKKRKEKREEEKRCNKKQKEELKDYIPIQYNPFKKYSTHKNVVEYPFKLKQHIFQKKYDELKYIYSLMEKKVEEEEKRKEREEVKKHVNVFKKIEEKIRKIEIQQIKIKREREYPDFLLFLILCFKEYRKKLLLNFSIPLIFNLVISIIIEEIFDVVSLSSVRFGIKMNVITKHSLTPLQKEVREKEGDEKVEEKIRKYNKIYNNFFFHDNNLITKYEKFGKTTTLELVGIKKYSITSLLIVGYYIQQKRQATLLKELREKELNLSFSSPSYKKKSDKELLSLIISDEKRIRNYNTFLKISYY